MKKGLKRILSLGMSILFVVVAVLMGNPVAASAGTSTSWNFKNTNFKNLGTISSTVTVDNLTLIATSAKTMSVIENNQTVNGTAYTHALSLYNYRTKIPRCSKSTFSPIKTRIIPPASSAFDL